jgi:p-hydroxybenzoate 3-monooxygenase
VAVEQTLIRAPFDGVVLTKNANVGDVITPFSSALGSQAAVVTMADMATLEVEADVSESNLGKIKIDQPCEIQLDAIPDMRFRGRTIHVDLPGLTGRSVMIYGQQEVVKDLINARLAQNEALFFEAEVTRIEGLETERPVVHFTAGGVAQSLSCDFVAGCDGYHGVSRASVPRDKITIYDRTYDFAWLGVLSRSPPIAEMTYTNSDRGFALCSRRSPQVSRLYLQVPYDEEPENWSDGQFWDELHTRMFDQDRSEIVEGEIFQRDVARLRAFVASPMQYGRLFLAGDSVHIVPPTGAKGLNLAVADARVLARGLEDFYAGKGTDRLETYSQICLRRIWKTVRYSNYMTGLLHRFPSHSDFDRELQLADLEYIASSTAAQKTIAEQYVGLAFEQPF